MRKAVIITTSTQIIIQILGVVTGILVTRWLGATGRGEIAAVISWVAMITYLGNLGLPNAFTYSSAKSLYLRHQILAHGVILSIVQVFILGAIGVIVINTALAKNNSHLINLAIFYLWAYLPINLLTLYLNSVQQGVGNYVAFNLVRVSVPLSYAICLLILFKSDNLDSESTIFANITGNLIALILAVGLAALLLSKPYKENFAPLIDIKNLKKQISFGLKSHFGTIQPFYVIQIDVLILTAMASTYQIGLYMAALSGANIIKAQAVAIGQVLFPEVAKKDDSGEQWRVIIKFIIITIIIGTLSFLTVYVYAEKIITIIFGEEFRPAASILILLVTAAVINAIYRILSDGLKGMGHPELASFSELLGLIIGISYIVLTTYHSGKSDILKTVAISQVIYSFSSLSTISILACRKKVKNKT